MKIFRIPILLFIAFNIVANSADLGPNLYDDLTAKGGWERASPISMREKRCSKFLLIINDCAFTIDDPRDEKNYHELSYFSYGEWLNEPQEIVWSRSDHAIVSTDRAVQNIFSRLVSFFLLISLLPLYFIAVNFRRLLPKAAAASGIPARVARREEAAPAAAASAAAPSLLPSGGPRREFGRRRRME